MFPPLPDKKFSIIYADPPWEYPTTMFSHGAQEGTWVANSNAADHYQTVTLEHLKGLCVRDVAKDDCLLYMWTTGPKLKESIELGEAWGFKYVTVAFVWHKVNKPNPGNYTMSSCEYVQVFKRGRIPLDRGTRNERQFYSSRVARHSEKPWEIRDRISRMHPYDYKLEMFCRQEAPDEPLWTFWGNEVAPASNLIV